MLFNQNKCVTPTVELQGEEFILHPLKFLFQKSTSTLICADLHVGKSGHFRANGIALPRLVNKNNFWNLMVAFDDLKPERLMMLGDMVHSKENHEWDEFADFLDNYPGIEKQLIRGNHEICDDQTYTNMGFDVVNEKRESPFLFLHEANQVVDDSDYQIAGHIHPSISLFGAGRQHLKVPCFWFGKKVAILPAAGTFTGTHAIRPLSGDRVFAVTGDEVIEVK